VKIYKHEYLHTKLASNVFLNELVLNINQCTLQLLLKSKNHINSILNSIKNNSFINNKFLYLLMNQNIIYLFNI
jgi:hypothetical protein